MQDNKINKELMLQNHSYPSPSSENLQEEIYKKREFTIHRIPKREKLETYAEIKEYRDSICAREVKLSGLQTLLSNFINPNTPYYGLLIFHGTGTGKTGVSIAIAEKFRPMVEKYGTRIHVLVPGPLNKQNYLNEIIKFTNESYMKVYTDKTMILTEIDLIKIKKNALNIINQYYRVMSYRSFYRKVLGEKIREKIHVGNKIKIINKKAENGELERELSIDRIYNLDNTLLIIDEAHNLTDNEYGNAVLHIIKNSKNLRVVLLSATPMINFADEIVKLLNFLRPIDNPIERSKIFTSQKNHLMEFKEDGIDYLKKMCRGYVSYLRGADPLTFAERIDVGEIPPGLSFTKVIRCFMLSFQTTYYDELAIAKNDSLDRKSEALADFVFPGLSKNKNDGDLIGYFGNDGIDIIKYQLKSYASIISKKIANTILSKYKIENPDKLIYLTDNNKQISGDIFHEDYLKYFSIKFYTALKNINENVYGKKGPGLIFVYSNLVKVGIELFQEVLKSNGYLEYQDSLSSYSIKSDTRCYFCDILYGKHNNLPKNIIEHEFYPATYISFTGRTEENVEYIPEEKFKILDSVFNNIDNRNGKYIKIILGSKVINEGVNLSNIKEIHILDVYFNLGNVDQAIGRGIRFCRHYNVSTEENPYPKVYVFKYVISIKGKLSTEEDLYKKAEQKYLLIKQTENILKEEAIDCPLNYNGNIFPEEIEKYKGCGSKENPCPAVCGYLPCVFKCSDKSLNAKYYDPNNNIYKKVAKADIDYSTYDNSLAREEINYAKDIIKSMFHLEHVYILDDILKYVKYSYSKDKADIFDDYYVYQALDELLPITSNDFNNFHDTFTDKFNRPGYLIYRDRYYIFQPFDEPEDVPLYYRQNYKKNLTNKISLKEYIHNTQDYKKYITGLENNGNSQNINSKDSYDFDSAQNYYDSREEFDYVGIIDQESTRKKNKNVDLINDEFKIRPKRPRYLKKKRETGLPSFKGAVCNISQNKKLLTHIAKILNIELPQTPIRKQICSLIYDKLFDLEKYSTSKDKNKMTYLIIPVNHPIIPFPLNLEDRIKNLLNNLKDELKINISPNIIINKAKGLFTDIKYVTYTIEFTNMDKYADTLIENGFVNKNNTWIKIIE